MEKMLVKLQKESKSADEKYRTLHDQIAALRNKSGSVLLREGSDSKAYKDVAKKIKEAEESVEDLLTLKVALENAIKAARKEIRRQENAAPRKRTWKSSRRSNMRES